MKTVNLRLVTYDVPVRLMERVILPSTGLPTILIDFSSKKVKMSPLPDISAQIKYEISLSPEVVKQLKGSHLSVIVAILFNTILNLMYNSAWSLNKGGTSISWSEDNTHLSIVTVYDLVISRALNRYTSFIPSREELESSVKRMEELLVDHFPWWARVGGEGITVLEGDIHFSVLLTFKRFDTEVEIPSLRWKREMERWDKERWFDYVTTVVTFTAQHTNPTFIDFISLGFRDLDNVVICVVNEEGERKVF